MRLRSKLLLAGLGATALAGSAYAADRAMHVMQVVLPGGAVAKVHYVGDVAPKIEMVPVTAAAIPVAIIDPGFADFDRMFAGLDRQAAAMMRQAHAMPLMAGGKVDQAALKSLPAGTVSYSYSVTSSVTGSGNGGCTQSYQMTSFGNGAAPKVVSQSSGDCGKAKSLEPAPTPVRAETPAAKTVPPGAV